MILKVLSKILGIVPLEERKGIRLEGWPRWKVQPVRDVSRFLQAIVGLVPCDSVLYLEGGNVPQRVRTYLKARSAEKTCKVEMGTIWPRPSRFHMAATQDNFWGLAELAEHCAAPEIAVHLHIYADERVMLEWYDAFGGYPLHISGEVSEQEVQAFCYELETVYEQETKGA